MNAPEWQASRARRLQVALIAGVLYPLLEVLRWTLTWRVGGQAFLDDALADEVPPIIGFWHGRILPGMCFFRRRGIVVITSQNFDGEWIARVIRRFGYGTARGSSSRNAAGALRELIRQVRRGQGAAFTLDGPRGPARVAKGGAVWLAGATGSRILPFHAEATRAWTTRSWDRTLIPKPFSTVCLAFAEPLSVPRDLDGEGIEEYCRILEVRLAGAETAAAAMAAGARP